MNTIIFDGKYESGIILAKVEEKITKNRHIKPRLASILIGDDAGSLLYLSIKKKAAEKIGATLEVKKFDKYCKKEEILDFIKKENINPKTHGIMVQLPIPDNFSAIDEKEIIESIDDKKDVDGMKKDSMFITPVILAVDYALKSALSKLKNLKNPQLVVIGCKGFVGGHIFKYYKNRFENVLGIDSTSKDSKRLLRTSDVVISATGEAGIIKKGMIKKGSVVIDVGAPMGDVIKQDVLGDAFFVSPVPGGIGPMTVSFLMQNLVDSFLKS